ncbi:aerolysin family beta-barrel pore-forming toxin, partial [Paraclostridium dentum]|uniref:aerolysin family beta-barrel pore-forming toxin n=1 Tax=Paraclostridium dentum TaxID=2662455 RepID=UPI0014758563
AGSATLFNDKTTEAELKVSITYSEEASYTFTRSLSLSTAVTSSITFGLPLISEASISVTHEISTTMQWENTESNTTSVTAESMIPVPASSSALISYVGTKGSCSIPFHYRQVDRRSTDGGISDVERTDGIYTGVNCYNFHFTIVRVERLA